MNRLMAKFKIKDILYHFPECKFVGNDDCELSSVVAIKDVGSKALGNSVSWISDKKLETLQAPKSLGLLIL